MPGVREQIKIRPPGRVMMQLNRDMVEVIARLRLLTVKNFGGGGHCKAPEMRVTWNKEAFVTAGERTGRERRRVTLLTNRALGCILRICL